MRIKISYTRYKINSGKVSGSGTTSIAYVTALSGVGAIQIIKTKHPGYYIRINSMEVA